MVSKMGLRLCIHDHVIEVVSMLAECLCLAYRAILTDRCVMDTRIKTLLVVVDRQGLS